ncbi:MAG: hypothetical protein ABIX01_06330 [Chitinophagaceae bacterium]
MDTAQTYQSMDDFGYTFTGGSATLINALPLPQKDDLLKDLFQWVSNYIGVSYPRITVWGSNLSATNLPTKHFPIKSVFHRTMG